MVEPEGASDSLRENFLEEVGAQPRLQEEKVAACSKGRLSNAFWMGLPYRLPPGPLR